MKRRLFQLSALAALTIISAFGDTTIYNTNPNPLPGNLPSLGYEATSTTEFGGLIQFAPGPRNLTLATVTMSNWAKESEYETVGTSAGYTHPLTLNIYNVGALDTVGSLIGSQTINALVPWRPETTAGCATGWGPSCFNGFAFQVTFAFGGLVVPDSVIYGLAYNTADYGAPPIHAAGPYNSLNFALSLDAPSVGTNPLPDTAYWNTSYAGFYTDKGAGGVGTFRQDTDWSTYHGAIEIQATTPEPGAILLFGTVVGALTLLRRKRTA